MKEHKNLIANLREHAQWAEANEWETPIMLSDNLKEAADLIERQAAEIDAAQTVDAVEVVRCKDCKHKGWIQEPCHGKSVDFCHVFDSTINNPEKCFCYYGERKRNETD